MIDRTDSLIRQEMRRLMKGHADLRFPHDGNVVCILLKHFPNNAIAVQNAQTNSKINA